MPHYPREDASFADWMRFRAGFRTDAENVEIEALAEEEEAEDMSRAIAREDRLLAHAAQPGLRDLRAAAEFMAEVSAALAARHAEQRAFYEKVHKQMKAVQGELLAHEPPHEPHVLPDEPIVVRRSRKTIIED